MLEHCRQKAVRTCYEAWSASLPLPIIIAIIIIIIMRWKAIVCDVCSTSSCAFSEHMASHNICEGLQSSCCIRVVVDKVGFHVAGRSQILFIRLFMLVFVPSCKCARGVCYNEQRIYQRFTNRGCPNTTFETTRGVTCMTGHHRLTRHLWPVMPWCCRRLTRSCKQSKHLQSISWQSQLSSGMSCLRHALGRARSGLLSR